MRTYVTLEQPRPGEALAAIVALAALIVSPHVHTEGRHTDVDLVAVRASPGLLISQRSVRLPVPREVRRGRVLLAAIGALVVFVVFRFDRLRRVSHSASSLGRDDRHRRRSGDDRRLREARFLLRGADGIPRRGETDRRLLIGAPRQDLALRLDSLEEQPRPFLDRKLILVARCHLNGGSRSCRGPARFRGVLSEPGRRRSLVDNVAAMDQGAGCCREAHLRQFRQVVQFLGALGRRLAAALAGAIGSQLPAAVIGQSHASLGAEI